MCELVLPDQWSEWTAEQRSIWAHRENATWRGSESRKKDERLLVDKKKEEILGK